MPYTAAQCRKFALMAKSKTGPRPPSDWRAQCRKKKRKTKKR
jgi:hypothetical protein